MPAYRSEAEGEIREEVVKRLREIMPGCRIIHEINASSFGNRIDVLAVGAEDLAAVEIKSEKDKLDRLKDQNAAMYGVSNKVFNALHEKFLTPPSEHLGYMPPNKMDYNAYGAIFWIYPRKERRGHFYVSSEWHSFDRFEKPVTCLPEGALYMLHRQEMHEICRSIGLKSVSSLTMDQAVDQIRLNMSGREWGTAVCKTLRQRKCVEADPPIFDDEE